MKQICITDDLFNKGGGRLRHSCGNDATFNFVDQSLWRIVLLQKFGSDLPAFFFMHFFQSDRIPGIMKPCGNYQCGMIFFVQLIIARNELSMKLPLHAYVKRMKSKIFTDFL